MPILSHEYFSLYLALKIDTFYLIIFKVQNVLSFVDYLLCFSFFPTESFWNLEKL